MDSAPSLGRGENAVEAPCKLVGGSVSERPKERASKAREVQASVGSNPTATASLNRRNAGPTPAREGLAFVVSRSVGAGGQLVKAGWRQ